MYQKMAKTKKTTRYTRKMPRMMYMSRVLRAEMKKSAAAAAYLAQDTLPAAWYVATGGPAHTSADKWMPSDTVTSIHLESIHE